MDRNAVELTRLCSYCEREATDLCHRCGVSVCRVHTPIEGRRCGECEAEYRATRSKRAVLHAAATAGVVFLLLGLVFLFAVGTGGGALALAPLILFCAVPLTLFKLELRARSRFLSENRVRRLPPAKLLSEGGRSDVAYRRI